MANKPDRRAIIRAYKEMDDIGGVYRYVNTKTGWKSAPQATPNLKGQKSKLEFAKAMKIEKDSSADRSWIASCRNNGRNTAANASNWRSSKTPNGTGADYKGIP
jgi:hypothetical protein